MRIAVLVPSQEYKAYAGARIRYGRVGPKLAEQGIELVLEDLAKFEPQSAHCDALIISKCHDARSLLAAAIMADRGRLVGVDLFDDYFSQQGDSRLARFRNWLRQLLPSCDFALCSTPVMAGVVASYRSDLPTHVMNDPAPPVDAQQVEHLLAKKLIDAQQWQRIRVAWFGVGDNPHFPVGLDDLAAFGGTLRELSRSGMDVELHVVTNARALTAHGLSCVRQLPIRTHIHEWSEAAERELLEDALLAFLPVSSQAFSAAKSLNRAMTALTAGCQVLSVGYPLYDALQGLIYTDAGSFIGDLSSGLMRHSTQRLDVYRAAIQAFGSADADAAALALFLGNLDRPQGAANGALALVHGHATNGAAHKLVQAVKGLSIASPYCATAMGFDVIFRGAAPNVTMFVSEKAAGRLRPESREQVRPSDQIEGRRFFEFTHREPSAAPGHLPATELSDAALPFQLATYAPTMGQIRERIEAAFGECRLIVSETSPLPFSPAD
jgi:hypothetical protein